MIACIVSGPGAADEIMNRAEKVLAQHGVECWQALRDQRESAIASRLRKTDLLMTLGGDGTFLAGARLAGPRGRTAGTWGTRREWEFAGPVGGRGGLSDPPAKPRSIKAKRFRVLPARVCNAGAPSRTILSTTRLEAKRPGAPNFRRSILPRFPARTDLQLRTPVHWSSF